MGVGGWGVAMVTKRGAVNMRRFWGVSRVFYRGSWQWLAQNARKPTQRIWKVGFETEDAAAKWLAKRLGVTMTSLERRDNFHLIKSKFQGVRPMQVGRAAIRWIGYKGDAYVGTFKTEKAAAAAVAKHTGTPAPKLRRKVGASGRRAGMSTCRARVLFKASFQHFKTYTAGDYKNMLEMESKAAGEFKQDIE